MNWCQKGGHQLFFFLTRQMPYSPTAICSGGGKIATAHPCWGASKWTLCTATPPLSWYVSLPNSCQGAPHRPPYSAFHLKAVQFHFHGDQCQLFAGNSTCWVAVSPLRLEGVGRCGPLCPYNNPIPLWIQFLGWQRLPGPHDIYGIGELGKFPFSTGKTGIPENAARAWAAISAAKVLWSLPRCQYNPVACHPFR